MQSRARALASPAACHRAAPTGTCVHKPLHVYIDLGRHIGQGTPGEVLVGRGGFSLQRINKKESVRKELSWI